MGRTFPFLILILSLTLTAVSIPTQASPLSCRDLLETRRMRPPERAFVEQLLEKGLWQEAAWYALERGDRGRYAEIERRIEAFLSKAQIVGEPEVVYSGSSEVFKVQFEGNVAAIFKPDVRHWRRRARPFHYDNMPKKDAAAYKFDRAIGAYIVPVTIQRVVNGRPGSLQIFMKLEAPAEVTSKYRTRERLRALDALMGTWDRSPQNTAAAQEGVVGIDNSMAFITETPTASMGIQRPPKLEELNDFDFHAEFQGLRSLTGPRLRDLLKEELTEPELAKAAERLLQVNPTN